MMLREYPLCRVLILVALSANFVSADLERCAAVRDNVGRFACYDAMANESTTRRTQDAGQGARSLVIARCRTQMGEYGSRMVKLCVDQDMAAYETLQAYPDAHSAFIERCIRQMGEYGWRMIKLRADQDIEAERDLTN